ncbi:MAG: MFS transporter [Neisseria sp.]|uniref:MFS transporter n=1 Tax=Neisseria sp. TaxID=192066 RepID=UPI0026DBD46A|nr:MFS transporter [Neisseria sp.]MDO4641031.1 MFS transporter [Neisseria sp.]
MSDKKSPILLTITAIFLIACCLRAPIVSLGPLMSMVQNSLHADTTIMGVIGTIPVLVFAACSPFAAPLARRFGFEEVLIGALLALGFGILLRTAGLSAAWLLMGTFLLSIGIAMGNVLVSGVIKRSLPLHVARFTALYSITMSCTAALSAAAAVPLAQRIGWQASLNMWLIPVILALVVWITLRRKLGHQPVTVLSHKEQAVSVWRNKLAWAISVMMGLQSLLYYTFSAWLPTILSDRGIGADEAGYYAMLLQIAAIPAIFCVTTFSARLENPRFLALSVTLLSFIGIAGIWLLPYAIALWVFCVGAGVSGTFTLCLLLFIRRTDSIAEAATLSGMAQTVGYLIAATGPVGAGWLFAQTQSWDAGLAIMTLLMLVKCGCGWYCARPISLREAAGMNKKDKPEDD